MADEKMVNTERIKKLMKERTLTISQLATYSGIKYDTVYSLVKGRRGDVALSIIKPVADILGVTVDYLLGQDDTGEIVISRPLPPVLLRRLTESAARLSESRQEELLRISLTFEKMEEEEAQQDIPNEIMAEVMKLTKGAGPHATVRNLIIALRIILGNQNGGWMIDLGGPKPGGPSDPGEGE